MTYLLTFSCVIGLTFIYEHGKRENKHTEKMVIPILIILILSIVAGFRSPRLGTDNVVYLKYYNIFGSMSFKQALTYNGAMKESFEIGFVALSWLISRIGKNYFWFCFITSLITVVFTFLAMKYYENRFSITVSMICYLFMFYCPIINYVRQGIALSICFFAWRYAEQKKLVKFLLLVLLSTTIHIGAISAIPIYFIFSTNERKKRNKWVVVSLVIVIGIIYAGPMLMSNALEWAARFGFRSWTLLKYSRRFLMAGQYEFVPTHILQAGPQLLAGGFLYKKLNVEDKMYSSLYIMILIQLMFMIMGSIYQNFSRISLFYGYGNIFFLSCFRNYIKKSEAVIVIYCLIYWVFYTVTNHYGFSLPVYPYLANI